MLGEPREVTTFCPQCGRPIVWSVQPFEDGEQLEVSAFACHCALRDDEWDDMADDDAADDEPELRGVREDDPA